MKSDKMTMDHMKIMGDNVKMMSDHSDEWYAGIGGERCCRSEAFTRLRFPCDNSREPRRSTEMFSV